MEKAREKDYAVQASYFFLYFCLSNEFDHGCRASKSRESIQGPCLAVPSGKPIGLRIFMQCHQGNPSGSSRFLTPAGDNTRSKEFLVILPRACAKLSACAKVGLFQSCVCDPLSSALKHHLNSDPPAEELLETGQAINAQLILPDRKLEPIDTVVLLAAVWPSASSA